MFQFCLTVFTQGQTTSVNNVIYPRRVVRGHVHACFESLCQVSVMATTKRPQDECSSTDEKKKKKKKSEKESREEPAELCAAVEDEQVKRGVTEAWSRKTTYSHGQWEDQSSASDIYLQLLISLQKPAALTRLLLVFYGNLLGDLLQSGAANLE